ncbi:MAG: tRNA preQ1(34) S-adenosylmethionine ribosyltransferase-isomerase QueA [Candidatus Omnitrophica bacterium]|nr:tRNA preQ1(34) S-adenosylmethionine ribosyltransferase-isomerase QueA [Candidatus Omnitrophota bacterium]
MDNNLYNLSNYDYELPTDFIAQKPVCPRDSSRLLILDRRKQSIKAGIFEDVVDCLAYGDVIVLNDTKVIKAKLIGKKPTGAQIDILLVKQLRDGIWEALASPAKRLKVNDTIIFDSSLSAKIIDVTSEGKRVLEFSRTDIRKAIEALGKAPLPHYIKEEIDDAGKYQTIYAKHEGAIAAPTAGLHFTPQLLSKIEKKGIRITFVTLHCGLATFRPIKEEDIRRHKIEPEWVEVTPGAAKVINNAKKTGSRVIAVGTTSMRTLESAAAPITGEVTCVKPYNGETNLYITPGYAFKIVDAVITNFHTPRSTNLVLIASFCGLEFLRKAYNGAKELKFRFFSFGDAMFIS